jgi:DNA-damage-inducible protein D
MSDISQSQLTTSSPDFDAIRHLSPQGNEFWVARELMPLLGYNQWRRFEDAISRAKIACEQSGNMPDNHFVNVGKKVALGSGAKRAVKDYYLSRFACYLIAQNGDVRKPEIAAAQAYFAVSTRQNEVSQMVKRLEIREHLVLSEQRLTELAIQAGMLPENFNQFQDAGYKGLYGGLTQNDVKERKQVSPEEDLRDRMGEEELAANFFRSAYTAGKIRREEVSGEDNLFETHQEIGQAVRVTIQQVGGILPEELPTEPSLKPLLEEQLQNKNLPKQSKKPVSD